MIHATEGHFDDNSSSGKNKKKLERLRKEFIRVTSEQASRIQQLLEENAKLKESIANVGDKTADAEVLPLVKKPYIREELKLPSEFMKFVAQVENVSNNDLRKYFALTDPHRSSVGINRATVVIEQCYTMHPIGIKTNGDMLVLQLGLIAYAPTVLVPLSIDTQLSSGAHFSAVPNPQLFGHKHYLYDIPKDMRKKLEHVFDTTGKIESGNSSYKILRYPILKYNGDLTSSVVQKGAVEFLSTEDTVEIIY